MISKSEREELARVVRLRMKVAKADIDKREAILLADVEKQLSSIYKVDDSIWADITNRAKQEIAKADQEIARLCREHGILERFRPRLDICWYGRGENAMASRRAELRVLAKARIEVAVTDAKHAVESQAAEVLTRLIAGGLESDEARAFLESIPTAEKLLPLMIVSDLESKALTDGKSSRLPDEDD